MQTVLLQSLTILLSMTMVASPAQASFWDIFSFLYDNVDRSHTCYGNPKIEHFEKVDHYQKSDDEITEINYYQPKRQYKKLDTDYLIYIEASLENDKPLYQQSTKKLIKKLAEIEAILPKKAFQSLKKVPIYLMHGETAPMGGLARGMSYYRRGEPNYRKKIDSRWQHVIVINSATNYVSLDEIWSIKALVHEYAHAWHLSHFPDKHWPIRHAYKAAKNSQRYRNVKNNQGDVKKSVYAMTNHLEYFAELSAMYFSKADYCPFDRQTLKSFDKKGYDMVEKVWGIQPK